jgi:hypothetical protein
MVLNRQPSQPHTHAYVVKLHPDSRPGHLTGRLEHVASGRVFPFSSAAQLLECLEADLGSLDTSNAESAS